MPDSLAAIVLWQVRVAALDAIKQAVLLGGHEMIYQLGAFQDPNLVPMAAFYEPTVSVNYLSKLAQDANPQVDPYSLLSTLTTIPQGTSCYSMSLPHPTTVVPCI